MILTAYDPNQVADPFKSVLDFGLGIFGRSIENAISLGKQSNDLQNQQGAQFFSLLNEEKRQRDRQFEFAVGQANSNREFAEGVRKFDTTFGEGVRQFDTTFGEGVRKFDKTFNEGVRLNDRAFEYTKERDVVTDARANRSLTIQEFQAGHAVANANEANRRANEAAPLENTSRALENVGRSQVIADEADARTRRDSIVKQSESLLNIDPATGVQSVKPEATLSSMQDFVTAYQGEKDPRVQSAVGIAAAETSRRIKKATIEQLQPEVQGLRTELADLNAKIIDPATPNSIKDDYSKRVLAKEKLINEIVERFPELARPAGGAPGTAADGQTNYQNLLKQFGLGTKQPAKK